ncbi:MAG TPA: hypothetical protein PLD59_05090 [Tepidisphaeraceae bacterium]|nr:hypothetical protein [Tepidisphaeraceae bacterium]
MAKAQSAPATGRANRPVHEIRHRNVRATIWKNPVQNGVMYNVTVSRSYRDDNNEWHDTNSFPFNDLMNLAKALSDAHTFIAQLEAKARE